MMCLQRLKAALVASDEESEPLDAIDRELSEWDRKIYLRTRLPMKTIRAEAERICKENGARVLRAPVDVTRDGLIVVRSVYLPRDGRYLANVLLEQMGQRVERV